VYMYVLDGVVKTFEADSGKAVNSFFEHSGWVTEFISWFVKLYCQLVIHGILYIGLPWDPDTQWVFFDTRH